MPEYVYHGLNTRANEIRLLTLLPGSSDSPIQIYIEHAKLIPLPAKQTQRLDFRALQETLPTGKTAHETPEGRYFFGERGAFTKYWNHPKQDFPKAKYAQYAIDESVAEVDYEALSYEWGAVNEESNHHISVIDPDTAPGEGVASLSIRENLFQALKHIRYVDKSRRLWVDAICINQGDLQERGREITKMARIFSLAYRTIVWLGRASKDSDLAIETIKLWASWYIKDMHDLRCYRNPSGAFKDAEGWKPIDDAKQATDSDTLAAVSSLFGRSYFRRLWV
jgi:hypothetical protein